MQYFGIYSPSIVFMIIFCFGVHKKILLDSYYEKLQQKIRTKKPCSEIFIRKGQRIFLYVLKKYSKLKKDCADKSFTISFFLTLLSHYIYLITIFIIDLNKVAKLWFFYLTILHFTYVVSTIICYLYLIKPLYSTPKLMFKYSFGNELTKRFKYSAFYEIGHNKKKFAFTLGILGQISSKMILRFVLMYCSYFMTLFPFIKNQHNSKLLKHSYINSF